jgi:LCP family protein required for cell wall assembly
MPLPPDEPGFGFYDDNGEHDGELPGWFLTPPVIEPNDDGTRLRPATRTNFLLMGIDHGSLADAIMVGTFYRDTGDIHIMSVPRDTHVVFSDARLAQLRQQGLNLPQQLKMSELRSRGGGVWGPQLVKQQVSEMMGVHFHYYVEVRIPAFRRIVDAIGGVYFNVPRRLFYQDLYNTPPTLIDVPAGHRRLTGVQAEGLVRYRGYSNADLGRNAVQKDFMVALLQQLMTRDALLNDPWELIRIVLDDTSSNMTLLNMGRYLLYLPPLRPLGEIRTFTMPGEAAWRNDVSVFLPNLNLLHDVANEVFRMPTTPPADDVEEMEENNTEDE